ncbi:uncharacterized protein LOC113060220 [Carassius auratus]|uniref:Uncharacterized protein LOC113060220 n=2 Tax=Carassius TaxID=7956 RepID=A0A6P6LML2_CARAU|nr:uncharacterized protein LOC113060220 [Carassius auratus]
MFALPVNFSRHSLCKSSSCMNFIPHAVASFKLCPLKYHVLSEFIAPLSQPHSASSFPHLAAGMVRSSTAMRPTPFSVFMFAIITLTGYSQVSGKNEECPAEQETSCESLRTTEGFTYPVPLNIPTGDCEYSWHLVNGTCVAHSDGKKLRPVVAMTSQNVTVSACEDLQWQLHCDDIQFHCTINYTVTGLERTQDGNHNDYISAGLPGWGTALIGTVIGIGMVVGLIAVWFHHRNKSRGYRSGS